MTTRAWLLCLSVLACSACSFRDRHEACAGPSECGNDQVCFEGFCVRPDEGSARGLNDMMSGTEQAGSGSRAELKSPDKSRPDAGAVARRPDASADTRRPDAGAVVRRSDAGTGASGAVSEVADSGAPRHSSESGAAGGGGGNTPVPDSDSSHADAAVSSMSMLPSSCEPHAEECNGSDDDCDGQIDESTATDCYPDGQAGCTRDAAGRWMCVGTCSTGKRACVEGKLQNCAQFKPPSTEVCTDVGMQAADEDCNGATDEICACTSGEVSSCYDGRAGTRDVGQCKSGTQLCTDGRLGPCMGQVTPSTETCNGVDDDCNGKVDEGFNLKHDQNNCGECGRKCAGDEMCKGGQCMTQKMGPADPPPPSEPNKGCSPGCGTGQTCCGHTCVDISADANNCGMCGNACTGANKPGCCNGKCVDLVSNQHCGRCGHDCSLLGNGGITCSCAMSGNGDIACTGPVLNLCL